MSPKTASLLKKLKPWLEIGQVSLGIAAASGLAPLGFWWLAIPAFALLFWRILNSSQPVAATFAAGLGFFGFGLSWIVEPFLIDIGRHGWMAPFALLLMAAGGALFWALPAAIGTRIACTSRGWRVIAIAVLLFLSDWLRGWIFTGFPWARLGQLWTDTPIAQSAAYIGSLGLSAVTLAIAGLFSWRPVAGGAMAAALGISLTLWGSATLDLPLPAQGNIKLRLVQPNADQALKWDPVWGKEFYRRLLDLSREEGALGRPDLILWPETAVNFVLEWQPQELARIAEAAGGATTITGIQRAEGRRFYNSLIAISPEGELAAVYDKNHLVPFGEYIPFGDLLGKIGIGAFASQTGGGYSAGQSMQVMSIEGVPDLQPLICYEAIFPHHLREVTSRPQWLLQITNDAWFGKLLGPYQHLEQARLRAIEAGLPMIRAANTGVSAVIDPRGRILASLELGETGKIDALLPPALPPTFWIRWGDLPLLAISAALLALVLIRRRWTIDPGVVQA